MKQELQDIKDRNERNRAITKRYEDMEIGEREWCKSGNGVDVLRVPHGLVFIAIDFENKESPTTSVFVPLENSVY